MAVKPEEQEQRKKIRCSVGKVSVLLGSNWKEMTVRVRNGAVFFSLEGKDMVTPLIAFGLETTKFKKETEADAKGRPHCFSFSHPSLPNGKLIVGAINAERRDRWLEVLEEEADKISLHDELCAGGEGLTLPDGIPLSTDSTLLKSAESVAFVGLEWPAVLGRTWNRRLAVVRAGHVFLYSPDTINRAKEGDEAKGSFDCRPSEVVALSPMDVRKVDSGEPIR